jgi:hypothetical protein
MRPIRSSVLHKVLFQRCFRQRWQKSRGRHQNLPDREWCPHPGSNIFATAGERHCLRRLSTANPLINKSLAPHPIDGKKKPCRKLRQGYKCAVVYRDRRQPSHDKTYL